MLDPEVKSFFIIITAVQNSWNLDEETEILSSWVKAHSALERAVAGNLSGKPSTSEHAEPRDANRESVDGEVSAEAFGQSLNLDSYHKCLNHSLKCCIEKRIECWEFRTIWNYQSL